MTLMAMWTEWTSSLGSDPSARQRNYMPMAAETALSTRQTFSSGKAALESLHRRHHLSLYPNHPL